MTRRKHQPAMPNGLLSAIREDAIEKLALTMAPVITVVKTLRNPYSVVYVLDLQLGNFRKRLYVKYPHSDHYDKTALISQLQNEHQIMTELNQRLAKGVEYGVAVPFAFYPDYPAIVTFEAATRTVRDHMKYLARIGPSRFFLKTLIAEISNCGAWLRDFQETTEQTSSPFNTTALKTYCKVRLDYLLREGDAELSEEKAADILGSMDRYAVGIRAGENRVVGCHSDFAGHNILASHGRIWVLDFSMFRHDSHAFDPCNFWFDLEMLKIQPTYSRRVLSALQHTFIDAYGLIAPDSNAFQLARCQYSLNRLASPFMGVRTVRLNSGHRRRLVRSCLDWLEGFAG